MVEYYNETKKKAFCQSTRLTRQTTDLTIQIRSMLKSPRRYNSKKKIQNDKKPPSKAKEIPPKQQVNAKEIDKHICV